MQRDETCAPEDRITTELAKESARMWQYHVWKTCEKETQGSHKPSNNLKVSLLDFVYQETSNVIEFHWQSLITSADILAIYWHHVIYKM